MHMCDCLRGHGSWKCIEICSLGSSWWRVNIGSGNGLVPSCNKPLPHLVLTHIYDISWHRWSTINQLDYLLIINYKVRHDFKSFPIFETGWQIQDSHCRISTRYFWNNISHPLLDKDKSKMCFREKLYLHDVGINIDWDNRSILLTLIATQTLW